MCAYATPNADVPSRAEQRAYELAACSRIIKQPIDVVRHRRRPLRLHATPCEGEERLQTRVHTAVDTTVVSIWLGNRYGYTVPVSNTGETVRSFGYQNAWYLAGATLGLVRWLTHREPARVYRQLVHQHLAARSPCKLRTMYIYVCLRVWRAYIKWHVHSETTVSKVTTV
jgi:hypothetical protein